MNEEDGIDADGHIVQLETIKTPVFDSSGELIGVLGIGREDRILELKKEVNTLLTEQGRAMRYHSSEDDGDK